MAISYSARLPGGAPGAFIALKLSDRSTQPHDKDFRDEFDEIIHDQGRLISLTWWLWLIFRGHAQKHVVGRPRTAIMKDAIAIVMSAYYMVIRRKRAFKKFELIEAKSGLL